MANFIYSQSDLEQQIGEETYLTLISLNVKDKYAGTIMSGLIQDKIIEAGAFETWKLKKVLTDFLTQPEKLDIHLDKIYQLYCGIYQGDEPRKYEYTFLGNLALNFLYWTEKGYLETFYGDNWKSKYEEVTTKFEFYHKQLKGFATQILLAIDNKEIEILNDGTYTITDELKRKLEPTTYYVLKEPNGE
ncbi:MAG: hypothetical protein JNM36_17145 [Chitinophagales bacterium]|nr:hypothetical protein [Chitinophagales bacterium]